LDIFIFRLPLVTPASSATPLTSNQHVTPRHHSILPPTLKAPSLQCGFHSNWFLTKQLSLLSTKCTKERHLFQDSNTNHYKAIVHRPCKSITKYPLLPRGTPSATIFPQDLFSPQYHAITNRSYPRLSINTSTPHKHYAPTVTKTIYPRLPTNTPSPIPTSTSLFHFLQ